MTESSKAVIGIIKAILAGSHLLVTDQEKNHSYGYHPIIDEV